MFEKVNVKGMYEEMTTLVRAYRAQEFIGGFFGFGKPSTSKLIIDAIDVVTKNLEQK